MVRAVGLYPTGRGFESLLAYLKLEGGWRSWLARHSDIVKATGSNPVPPTFNLSQRGFVL